MGGYMSRDFAENYLRRLGLEKAPALSPAGLRELHLAQACTIPFETIAPYLGDGVSLDPSALEAKLIRQDRGGYCFELNGLFLEALLALGFRARPLLARVLIGNAKPGPLTHQLSLVEFDGVAWIADVGFGGPGLREPMRLGEETVEQSGRRLRMQSDPSLGWILQQNLGEGWTSIYAFDLREVRDIDREMGNHFTCTWPRSLFRKRLMAARLTKDGRITLDDRSFRRYGPGGLLEEKILESATALGKVLAADFGIALSQTTLYALDERLDAVAQTTAKTEGLAAGLTPGSGPARPYFPAPSRPTAGSAIPGT
jgi:N-hydroxyarylamine O-acetyltransferase